MKQPSVDDKPKPELIGFRCVCGIEFVVDLRCGPAKFAAECPVLECRRVYQVEYIGRIPAAAVEIPPLRLAQ